VTPAYAHIPESKFIFRDSERDEDT
jgi:hypothetical protein